MHRHHANAAHAAAAPEVNALIAFDRFEDLSPEGEHRADQQRGKRIYDPEQESVDHVIAPCEPRRTTQPTGVILSEIDDTQAAA